MGTTKIHGIQDILLAARDLLDSGGNVPVELVPEPDNPKDNRAIAFRCLINDKWHIFGYSVPHYKTGFLIFWTFGFG